MYVDWWPYLMGHGYEILSLYIGINIRSNIYTGMTNHENTTKYVMKNVIRYSHSDNGVYHS